MGWERHFGSATLSWRVCRRRHKMDRTRQACRDRWPSESQSIKVFVVRIAPKLFFPAFFLMSYRTNVWVAVFLASLGVPALAASCHPNRPGFYTQSQAHKGHTVYIKNCAECHGATLSGVSAPALSGPNFKSFLAYSKMSAVQLFQFIRSQMPNNQPGSLTRSDYLAALAFILKYNKYPHGTVALTLGRLRCLSLLPFPAAGKSP